jgi:hypothetical protein
MRLGFTPSFALPLVATLACAAPRPSPVVLSVSEDAGSRPAPTHAAPPAILVWSQLPDKSRGPADTGMQGVRTDWLDASGRVVRSQEGASLAIDGVVWTFAIDKQTRASQPCSDAEPVPEPSTVETASLASADGDRRLAPSSEVAAEVEAAPVVHKIVTLAGNLGPYLFVRDYGWFFGCGAHGFWSTVPHVYDARSGKEASFDFAADAKARGPQAEAKEKLRAIVGDVVPPGYEVTASDVQYVASEPRVSPLGVSIAHVYLTGVPYAFGASVWSSYAVDAEVTGSAPADLAPYLSTPPQVEEFIRTHPDRDVRGWTTL